MRKPFVTFRNCSKERWDAIFGEWTPEKFKQAAKKPRRIDKENKSAHIENARLYKGFDRGLGCHIEDAAHRRRVMREKNLVEAYGGGECWEKESGRSR